MGDGDWDKRKKPNKINPKLSCSIHNTSIHIVVGPEKISQFLTFLILYKSTKL